MIAQAFLKKEGRGRREGLGREFEVQVSLGCCFWPIIPPAMFDLDSDLEHAQVGPTSWSVLLGLHAEKPQGCTFCCVH